MQARDKTPHRIAGYCRISVDVEADRDNTSIENQKDIISDYVQRHFPQRRYPSSFTCSTRETTASGWLQTPPVRVSGHALRLIG